MRTIADVLTTSQFDSRFSAELPISKFCWNVGLLSLISLTPFLFVFVLRTPEFFSLLLSNPTALGRFARQIVTNGFPVVFVVNYVGFVAVHVLSKKPSVSVAQFVLLDGVMRAIGFVGLHILIYVFSADLFGSFGGDRGSAFRVVGPTLVGSILFANVSSVYLYALVPGAFLSYSGLAGKVHSPTEQRSRPPFHSPLFLASFLPVLWVTLLAASLNAFVGAR